jgi:hypothetical protein
VLANDISYYGFYDPDKRDFAAYIFMTPMKAAFTMGFAQ